MQWHAQIKKALRSALSKLIKEVREAGTSKLMVMDTIDTEMQGFRDYYLRNKSYLSPIAKEIKVSTAEASEANEFRVSFNTNQSMALTNKNNNETGVEFKLENCV